MLNEERVKLVNSIERVFFERAFEVFNDKHSGDSNKITEYLKDDEYYLLKYYNTFTKNWLTYLNEDELNKLLLDQMNNDKGVRYSAGGGRA